MDGRSVVPSPLSPLVRQHQCSMLRGVLIATSGGIAVKKGIVPVTTSLFAVKPTQGMINMTCLVSSTLPTRRMSSSFSSRPQAPLPLFLYNSQHKCGESVKIGVAWLFQRGNALNVDPSMARLLSAAPARYATTVTPRPLQPYFLSIPRLHAYSLLSYHSFHSSIAKRDALSPVHSPTPPSAFQSWIRAVVAILVIALSATEALLHVDSIQAWWIANTGSVGQDILVWALQTEAMVLANAKALLQEIHSWIMESAGSLLQPLWDWWAQIKTFASNTSDKVTQSWKDLTESMAKPIEILKYCASLPVSLYNSVDWSRAHQFFISFWAHLMSLFSEKNPPPSKQGSPAVAVSSIPETIVKAPQSAVSVPPSQASSSSKQNVNVKTESAAVPHAVQPKEEEEAEKMDMLATELLLTGAESILAPAEHHDEKQDEKIAPCEENTSLHIQQSPQASCLSSKEIQKEKVQPILGPESAPINTDANQQTPVDSSETISETNANKVSSPPGFDTTSVTPVNEVVSSHEGNLSQSVDSAEPSSIADIVQEPKGIIKEDEAVGDINVFSYPSSLVIASCIRHLQSFLFSPSAQNDTPLLPKKIAERIQGDLALLAEASEHLIQELETKFKSELDGHAKEYQTQLQSTIELAKEALVNQAKELEASFAIALKQQKDTDANAYQQAAAKLVDDLLSDFEIQKAAFRNKLEEVDAYWKQHIAERVDQERSGRLARLSELSDKLNDLLRASQDRESLLSSLQTAHQLQLALSGLRDTLSRSHHSCEQELELVAELVGHIPSSQVGSEFDTVLSTIPQSVAREGVLAFDDLYALFDTMKPALERTQYIPQEHGHVTPFTYLLSVLGYHLLPNPVKVQAYLDGWTGKSKPLPSGDSVMSVLARAEYYLQRHNLDAATREMNQLHGWPKRLASDWLRESRKSLEVAQALQVLELLSQQPVRKS